MDKRMVKKDADPKRLIPGLIIGIVLALYLGIHASANDSGNLILTTIAAFKSIATNPFSVSIKPSFLKYSIMYIGFALLCVFYWQIQNEKNARLDKNPGGNAKWTKDLTSFKQKYTDNHDQFNNIILTQNVALSMNTHQTRRNNNVIVVGGSGAGKTRFMIKPNIMQANCSFVITDPAGEILENEGEMLRRKGYKIKVFNLTDMEHSNSYNPMGYIRDNLGVLSMINCLIKNTNNGQKGGDPFWEKSETALLQSLVFYLIESKDIPEDQKNFTKIMELLREAEIDENSSSTESPLDKRMEQHGKLYPNSLAIKQYQTFKMGAGKTLKSILISCGVRLTVFNLPQIASLTAKDDLDLGSLGDEKTALFVVIPQADDTYNFLVSMMYSQLFETLYYRAENECPHEYWLKADPRFKYDRSKYQEQENKKNQLRNEIKKLKTSYGIQDLIKIKTKKIDELNKEISNTTSYKEKDKYKKQIKSIEKELNQLKNPNSIDKLINEKNNQIKLLNNDNNLDSNNRLRSTNNTKKDKIPKSNEVLAILRKGENESESDFESRVSRLKLSIKDKPIAINPRTKKPYLDIPEVGFRKDFDSMAELIEFKQKVSHGYIEKGSIRLPIPVRFLLDEFANIGQIPDFSKKLATMRKYEISCTIILQGLTQLKTLYKDDWESLIGNCDSLLFLGTQEFASLEYFSKLLGKETIVSRNNSRNRSAKGGGSGQSDSKQGKNLMDPNDIAIMGKDECFVIINGMHPFYDKKYNLENHPNFKLTGDASPNNKFDCKKEVHNIYANVKTEKMTTEDEMNAINELAGNPELAGNTLKNVIDDPNRNDLIITNCEVVVSEEESYYNYDLQ